jgi:hypothetical protein
MCSNGEFVVNGSVQVFFGKFDNYDDTQQIITVPNITMNELKKIITYCTTCISLWCKKQKSIHRKINDDVLAIAKYLECRINMEDFTIDDLIKNGYIKVIQYMRSVGYTWCGTECVSAARFGRLDVLKYLHENGYVWNSLSIVEAATSGHVACMKYLFENGCKRHNDIMWRAASAGQIESIKYAREIGCGWDELICYNAVLTGQYECIKFLHENNCPWDGNVYYASDICGGSNGTKCFNYAKENKCPREIKISTYHSRCMKAFPLDGYNA